jgi:ERCC4-type nuclease
VSKKPEITLLVDTREQTALEFADHATERVTLATGDYSVRVGDTDYRDRIAIERKSHADFWACCATERARFEQCLSRLARMERAAIVVECTLAQLCERPYGVHRVTPATAVGSMISWSVRYNLPVFLADNPQYAARVVVRWLLSFVKHEKEIGERDQQSALVSESDLYAALPEGSNR